MKISLLILSLLFYTTNVVGQKPFKVLDRIEIKEINKIFHVGVYEKEGYKIRYDSWEKSFYEKNDMAKPDYEKNDQAYFILRELDVNGKFISDTSLKRYHMDGAKIHSYHIGLRKFLVIKLRYSFLIVNLSDPEKAASFITPLDGNDGLTDAISGNVEEIVLFDDGQYLMANVRDLGFYCYSLRDLNNPKKISRFGDYKSYFFLDQTQTNSYNGIFVNREAFKPYFLFRSGQLKHFNDTTVVHVLNEQYLAVASSVSMKAIETVVIDINNGTLIHKEQFVTQLVTMNNDAGLLIVTLDNAWVRDKPTDGKVIMKLPLGSVCEILATDKEQTIRGHSDYWYKIKYNEKQGYIFGSQTSIKQRN